MINTGPPPPLPRVLVVEERDDESRDVLVFEIETDDAGAAAMRAETCETFRMLTDSPIV